jgi:hypothetical protein
METQDQSGLTLSEEQVAEVKRRLNQDDAKTITLAEFNQHLRRRYGI